MHSQRGRSRPGAAGRTVAPHPGREGALAVSCRWDATIGIRASPRIDDHRPRRWTPVPMQHFIFGRSVALTRPSILPPAAVRAQLEPLRRLPGTPSARPHRQRLQARQVRLARLPRPARPLAGMHTPMAPPPRAGSCRSRLQTPQCCPPRPRRPSRGSPLCTPTTPPGEGRAIAARGGPWGPRASTAGPPPPASPWQLGARGPAAPPHRLRQPAHAQFCPPRRPRAPQPARAAPPCKPGPPSASWGPA